MDTRTLVWVGIMAAMAAGTIGGTFVTLPLASEEQKQQYQEWSDEIRESLAEKPEVKQAILEGHEAPPKVSQEELLIVEAIRLNQEWGALKPEEAKETISRYYKRVETKHLVTCTRRLNPDGVIETECDTDSSPLPDPDPFAVPPPSIEPDPLAPPPLTPGGNPNLPDCTTAGLNELPCSYLSEKTHAYYILQSTQEVLMQVFPPLASTENVEKWIAVLEMAAANDQVGYLCIPAVPNWRPQPKTNWFWPLADPTYQYPISSCWGPRTGPVEGGQQLHYGLDVATPPAGVPVLAARTGEVVAVIDEGSEGCGIQVILRHPAGSTDFIYTRYCHLGQSTVSSGTSVAARATIGMSGNTGYSTGHHLHFEVCTKNPRIPENRVSCTDPLQFYKP